MNKILQILLAFIFIIIAWEHTARLYETEIKPSVSLNFVARHLKTGWEKFGRFCARISSFFIHLKFEELWHTIVDLIAPLWKMFVSPFWWLVGYFSVVAEYKWPLLVLGGSLTIIAMLLWIMDRYFLGKIGEFLEKIPNFVAIDQSGHHKND